MKQVDYIIVGFGLAGMAFAKILQDNGKTFVVYDAEGRSASRVAAGLYNPVILKRYTLPWKAEEQFDMALPFFKELGKQCDVESFVELPVHRVLASIEDQNNWYEATDKKDLKRFLDPVLVKNKNTWFNAPHHLGRVKETGRLQIIEILNAYAKKLHAEAIFYNEEFQHDAVKHEENHVIYKTIKASKIVFAEGFGVKQNPFFGKLPLVGNKGEYMIIKAPELDLDAAVKTSIFIIPLGEDLYKVGATYNWQDKDWLPSAEAKEDLQQKLESVINCEYTVVDQIAGMRPTTGDRRALLGTHPHYKNLALLNGLGTRGIMMSVYLADMLYNHLEAGEELDPDVDLMRFASKFN